MNLQIDRPVTSRTAATSFASPSRHLELDRIRSRLVMVAGLGVGLDTSLTRTTFLASSSVAKAEPGETMRKQRSDLLMAMRLLFVVGLFPGRLH
ncbi:hypothetical protein [Rhizobium sp. CC-YZS058]|uniref:hypothetical protein n=1 Tax=Rhizobium sp. CC-YZS058 TaxID=3042153 RepID=UPI002B0595F4|nr:hypothetical protein [Rhizobium sp. CC-YZS058]MEA3537035.1 hypothetical protein [Rhizobium sp. CC-YZS058]